jgi:transcriptional regulator NrdR family protein
MIMGNVWECSACGADSEVYDSRPSGKGFIRRGRKCLKCGQRWTTAEISEPDREIVEALVEAGYHLRKLFSNSKRDYHGQD